MSLRLPKGAKIRNPDAFHQDLDKLLMQQQPSDANLASFQTAVLATALEHKAYNNNGAKFSGSPNLKALCFERQKAPRTHKAMISKIIVEQRRQERRAWRDFCIFQVAYGNWSFKTEAEKLSKPPVSRALTFKDPSSGIRTRDTKQGATFFEGFWGEVWRAKEYEKLLCFQILSTLRCKCARRS